jgi:hypothetical protein
MKSGLKYCHEHFFLLNSGMLFFFLLSSCSDRLQPWLALFQVASLRLGRRLLLAWPLPSGLRFPSLRLLCEFASLTCSHHLF